MMPFRRYILFVLLLVLGSGISAQKRLNNPEIYLGVHGGIKASTVLFSPTIHSVDILHSPLTGNGGLVFRYAEHRICALQIECNYMQHGWAEVYGVAGESQTIYSRHLHYIELPFMMHLGFGKKKFRALFNFGPQIGYCLADNKKVVNPGSYQFVQQQHEPIANRFDWGAVAGLGCFYKSDKIGVFQLEARFNFSLGGVFEVGQLKSLKMANPMGLSINLGYLWEFKKDKKEL